MSATMTDPLALEPQSGGWGVGGGGSGSRGEMARIGGELASLPGSVHGDLVCDWTDAQAPGISPAWVLLRRLAEDAPLLTVRHSGNPPHFLELLDKLHVERHAAYGAHSAEPTLERLVGRLGRWSVLQGVHARGVIVFLGRIATVVGQAFSRSGAWRISSLTRHIYETGITAIPIVALIAFLISVIVAYLGAQQLSRFGADIFVVDLVTIATLRDMGVLLTSIIVAGRSRSAFAAEIGVTHLHDETHAVRAMGMNPIELLVVPRVLALVIALPLLTVIADAM